jgi:O-antigen/teichoic acid export membrane protein
MSLKRILKLLAAFFMSQGVSVVTQLLVPPIFLHRYPHGLEMYGEWIALTAAVSYLGTLNSGIQTYGNNQMTLHYRRGEIKEAKTVQSSALRIMMMMVLVAAGVGVALLFLPIARWMGLRHIGSTAAALTLLLMILRLVTGWIFSFITNSYLMVGQLHRGVVWQNVQRLAAALALATFLWMRASFPILALTQLASMVLFTAIVLVEQRFHAPILVPSLRYGNLRDLYGVLKPSAYYMLYALGGFLCWQGPVLLIQKILGPAAVAVYAITRVVFNMARQGIVILTQSIGQENIELIARRRWKQLQRMYDLSERVVLFVNSAATVGALLACPFLLRVWLHKRELYNPGICMMMAAISAVMALRHHKWSFQYLSNRHEGVAKFCVAAYGAMIVFTALTLRARGIDAYLTAWLAAELLICGYVIRENQLLFPREFRPSLAPLLRLAVLLAAAFGAAAWPVWHDGVWPLHRVAAMAAAGTVLLLVISYFAFGLRELQDVFQRRLRRRFAVR